MILIFLCWLPNLCIVQLAKELLLPLAKDEQRKHKLKRLVQVNSYMCVNYFMGATSPYIYHEPVKIYPSWQLFVQHPNSYFMDVKCPGCYRITTVSFHSPVFPNIAKAPFSFIAWWWWEYYCRCSLTRRLLWSARDAPPSSASPPGVGPGSLKVSMCIRMWLGEGQGWQWPTMT